jgi:phosphate acetyltransferase
MTILDQFANKVKRNPKRIVFPEGENPVILLAVAQLISDGLSVPVILGEPENVNSQAHELRIDLSDAQVISPVSSSFLEEFINAYCTTRNMPVKIGRRLMTQPLYFGAMMVRLGYADCMIAGINHPTEEVIMVSELIIGLQPDISVVSSYFLMQIPNFDGGENGLLVFSDPAVNPDPDPQQLADIAVTTARSIKNLFGWKPRVAMLSFSTRGSASHPMVDKVCQAVSLAQLKDPTLLVDGEMQADAALVAAVASKKVGEGSPVAGKANVLIFPDLNSANISSKLVQRLAKANAFGPILQGFQKPVSDLSRGATVEDVYGAAIILSAGV